VALANGEKQFLGRNVTLGERPVGIIVGDPGGANEYRRRIKDYLNPGAQVCVDSPYRPTQPATWAELQNAAELRGYGFLIVDNLSAFVPGSLSDDNSIKALYEQIEWFPRHGIPALIIAHTSEKAGEYGYSRVPMGSSLIRFGPRWWGYVYRSRGQAVIEFDGNEGSPHKMMLTEPDGSPVFDVIAVDSTFALCGERGQFPVLGSA
jgi:hypothetical protein